MNNEKANNAKRGGEKLRIWEPHSVKRFMKSIWNIHEATIGKGPLSWNNGAPHAKIA